MKCVHCNYENDFNNTYCENCGAALSSIAEKKEKVPVSAIVFFIISIILMNVLVPFLSKVGIILFIPFLFMNHSPFFLLILAIIVYFISFIMMIISLWHIVKHLDFHKAIQILITIFVPVFCSFLCFLSLFHF